MASSVGSSYDISSLSAEELGKFISQEVLSGEALVEKLIDWRGKNVGIASSEGLHNQKSFIKLIGELTHTDVSFFSEKNKNRKYSHHLNHMQGRVWTFEDFPEQAKKSFTAYAVNPNETDKKVFLEAKEKVKKSGQSNAEYWNPSGFLPFRIRSYVLEFFETRKEDFASPYPIIDKGKYSSCLAQQIASDIETLKYYNICQRIEQLKKEGEPQINLYQLLNERTRAAIERSIFPDGYLIASGCSKHCLYVSLKVCVLPNTQSSRLVGSIFERGLFMKEHLWRSETDGISHIYPYVFSGEYTTDFLDQVLQNLRDSQKMKKQDAMPKIYQDPKYKMPLGESPEQEYSTYPLQTADNCVLANHDFSMLRIFVFQKLIDHLIRKEKKLAAECSWYDEKVNPVGISSDRRLEEAEAHYQTAIELEKGTKDTPKWERAFGEYKLAHELGLRKATAKLGFFYYYGLGTFPDLEQGIGLLKYSAEEGDSFGQAMYGLACMLGIGMDRDIEAAQYWLKRSADLKNQPGSLYARSLLFGINQFTKKFPQNGNDKQVIVEALKQAADEGDVYANHLLVWEGGPERMTKFQKSLLWKFPDALMEQAYKKRLENENSPDLDQLLESGYTFAAFLLGLVYLQEGKRTEDTAFEYFKKAADAGISQSYAYLADLCFQKNKRDEAIYYLNIGVACGMENAMYGLGLASLAGHTQDKNRGYEFLREAARRGSNEASLELAMRFESGTDCVKDPDQAKVYRESIQNKSISPHSYQLFQSLAFQSSQRRPLSLPSPSRITHTPTVGGYTGSVGTHHIPSAFAPLSTTQGVRNSAPSIASPSSRATREGPLSGAYDTSTASQIGGYTGGVGMHHLPIALAPLPTTQGVRNSDPGIASSSNPATRGGPGATQTKLPPPLKKAKKGLEKRNRIIHQP